MPVALWGRSSEGANPGGSTCAVESAQLEVLAPVAICKGHSLSYLILPARELS